MADSTIDSELFFLIDNWPGSPESRNMPYDNFLSAAGGHNVASATFYPIGTKVQVYCDGSVGKPGWSTLMYLQAVANADVAIAAKSVMAPDSATVWYMVTNDADHCVIKNGGGLCAIALSAMTTLYYGWFWVGGVCPEQYITAMGGNYATEGNLVAGPFTVWDLAADALGFGPTLDKDADTADGGAGAPQTPAPLACGFALAADAA